MLIVKNLHLTIGQFSLKNIDFHLITGEYFVIVGPSGSGKTLLMETIAGRYRPDAGDILFNNQSLLQLFPEQRKIGLVYQHYELFPHMTVEENITFSLRMKKEKKEIISDKLHGLAELLHIGHLLKRYPRNLSGGERQKVALARALIIFPEILLLDEPMSALDLPTKDLLQEEIKKIHQTFPITVLHVTHDMEEALYLADRIGIMVDGVLKHMGTPEEIINSPKSSLVGDFFNIERRIKKYEFLYGNQRENVATD